MILQNDTRKHLQAHHGDFSEFADRMVETYQGRFDQVFFAFLDQYIPPHEIKCAIDLGTGPGVFLHDLKARFPQAKIIGVEAQEAMLIRAKELLADDVGKGLNLIEWDLACPPITPIDNESVDLVTSNMVLHEMQLPTKLLQEIARILRPGGWLVLSDWIRFDLQVYSNGTLPETIENIHHFAEHCRYTPQDIVWMAACVALQPIEWMTRKQGQRFLGVFEKLATKSD
ncbi:hypothetical protein TI05_07220 [Achromatium sp. WMS3]|nr:hypothetical protein TI05_07220 [Achromatium sp. WMS3]